VYSSEHTGDVFSKRYAATSSQLRSGSEALAFLRFTGIPRRFWSNAQVVKPSVRLLSQKQFDCRRSFFPAKAQRRKGKISVFDRLCAFAPLREKATSI